MKKILESREKTAAIPTQEHQDITSRFPAQGFPLKSNYLESPLRATGLYCFSPHGNTHRDQTSTGKAHFQSTCSSHIPKIHMPSDQNSNGRKGRRDMKYHEQSHPTPPERVSLSWVTYTPSWEFPIPANLFPQNKQINSPLLLSFPPPKASSWICYMALQPLFPSIPEHPLTAFCLISQKKQLWRQLDASPELSERQHSPKHHFPKPPHRQLFLTQPRAFPRAASTFICPHQDLWGRFCKI